MKRVKIYGAGSIGNHLAYASRHLGWDVLVCDISDEALERMKNNIYPSRYGQWDEAIRLYSCNSAPEGDFDLICIGTPPESHLPLALKALEEEPQAILIEKPICTPSLKFAQELHQLSQHSVSKIFAGYDHVLGKASLKTEELIRANAIGEVQTIDVEFREHWEGIFKAHPWLKGPEDTYLGFWQSGGGASGEHSHAVNLWQHFAHAAGAGRVSEVNATMRYIREGRADYDNLCLMHLKTENGLIGRVVQDVVTRPSRKKARIQGTKGVLEWVNGYNPEGDAVLHISPGKQEEVHSVLKKRPDDFIEELKHIDSQIHNSTDPSGIKLERGLDTMLVVAAAHYSEQKKRMVKIDYSKGFTTEALSIQA